MHVYMEKFIEEEEHRYIEKNATIINECLVRKTITSNIS